MTVKCHIICMDSKYSIDDLQRITGFSRRTIRYYIVEELIAPPDGGGRGSFYRDSHLNTLLQIKSLQERGMKLEDIRGYFRMAVPEKPLNVGQVWVKYEIMPGFEINVRRDIDESQRYAIDELIRIAGRLMKKEGGDDEG